MASQEANAAFMAENEKGQRLKTGTAGEKGNKDATMDFRQDENGNLENSPWNVTGLTVDLSHLSVQVPRNRKRPGQNTAAPSRL